MPRPADRQNGAAQVPVMCQDRLAPRTQTVALLPDALRSKRRRQPRIWRKPQALSAFHRGVVSPGVGTGLPSS